jgi:hypothetical protein
MYEDLGIPFFTYHIKAWLADVGNVLFGSSEGTCADRRLTEIIH